MLRLGNTVDFPIVYWLQLLSDFIQFRFRRNLRLRNWKNSLGRTMPLPLILNDFPDSVTAKPPLSDLKNMRNLPGATYQMGIRSSCLSGFTSSTSGQPLCTRIAQYGHVKLINDWRLRENDRLLHAGLSIGPILLAQVCWTLGALVQLL